MIRSRFKPKSIETEPDFNYRGTSGSRLETLSDAVFAFSVTLLVVSLEVPETFSELLQVFKGFFSFLLSLFILFSLWHEHYIFFLRYGLRDSHTIFLNSMLLFLILYFVYPLKFLFGLFIKMAVFVSKALLGGSAGDYLNNQILSVIGPADLPMLMILYGLGSFGIFAIFGLMYRNAYSRRAELNLSKLETAMTEFSMYRKLLFAIPPLLSAVFAWLFRENAGLASFAAGIAYALYGFGALYPLLKKRLYAKAES